MPISKTDYVRGLQCEKMLWLDAHAPERRLVPPEVQARLDAGNEFGDKAMGVFGDYVETTVYREDGRLHFTEMMKKTQALLAAGENVICEGSFSWYGNFCAADILKRELGGYALYEVKNADEPREEFLVDLGFQHLIVRKCGVKLTGSYLLLRGDVPTDGARYVESGGVRYKIVDVSARIWKYDKVASDRIFGLGKLKRKDAPLPPVPVGAHCETPYRCWYYEYCHGEAKREAQGQGDNPLAGG